MLWLVTTEWDRRRKFDREPELECMDAFAELAAYRPRSEPCNTTDCKQQQQLPLTESLHLRTVRALAGPAVIEVKAQLGQYCVLCHRMPPPPQNARTETYGVSNNGVEPLRERAAPVVIARTLGPVALEGRGGYIASLTSQNADLPEACLRVRISNRYLHIHACAFRIGYTAGRGPQARKPIASWRTAPHRLARDQRHGKRHNPAVSERGTQYASEESVPLDWRI